jgi:hypothetical protein
MKNKTTPSAGWQVSASVLKEKEARLLDAAQKLKQEYSGLDAQIEQIIEAIKPWYLLPQGMHRPTVIGLWGMTGVGKTTLVVRLTELLGFADRLVLEDMGKHVGHQSYESVFQVQGHLSGRASVFVLDELHTARTVDNFNELDRPTLRDFWSFLDSGLIAQDPRTIMDYRTTLCERLDQFRYANNSDTSHPVPPSSFVNRWEVDQARRLLSLEGSTEELLKMALRDVEQWFIENINKVDERLSARSTYDFRQSLVFITGNLDELFTFTKVIDADSFSADELHEVCKKITISQIKNALLTRFRPEQVARMGNVHLLFPSLSRASFLEIIQRRLHKLAAELQLNFKISVKFDASVEEMLFRIGVIPAQGCRSIFSTISEVIESKMPGWIIKSSLQAVGVESLVVSYHKEHDEIIVTSHQQNVSGIFERHKLNQGEGQSPMLAIPEPLRQIIAIHEAGHAVTGIASFGVLPLRALLGTTIPGVQGLVQFPEVTIMSKMAGEAMLVHMLGGWVAERMVFGPERCTNGSETDLRNATAFVSRMLTELSMGQHIGISALDPYDPHTMTTFKSRDDQFKEECLRNTEAVAELVLENQRDFLMALADRLLKDGTCPRADMEYIFMRFYKGSAEDKKKIMARTLTSLDEEYSLRYEAFKKAA